MRKESLRKNAVVLTVLVLVVLPLVLVFLKASVLLKVPLLLPAYSLS